MRIRKITSWLLILTLLLTQILSPEVAQAASLALPDLAGEKPQIDTWRPSFQIGAISEEVKAAHPHGVLIHIQDAHAVFEAQANIQKLLQEVEAISGVKQIFLEGGSGALDPRLHHLINGGIQLNKEERESWMREGQLTGAEAFLMENENIRGLGLEDKSDYWINVEQYRRVDVRREESGLFLQAWHKIWDQQAGRLLEPSLKKYLDIYIQSQKWAEQSTDWFDALGQYVREQWGRNLNEPEAQAEFPLLTRYYYLKSLDQSPDFEKVEIQKKEFFKKVIQLNEKSSKQIEPFLREIDALINKAKSDQIDFSGARETFEQLADFLPDQFSLSDWPDLRKIIERVILLGEIKAEDLMDEAKFLHGQILSGIHDVKKQELVHLLENRLFLEKLLNLELSRDDFNNLQSFSMTPGELVQRLIHLSETDRSRNEVQLEQIETIYKDALQFYRGAVQRERPMKDVLLQAGQKDHIAVVVTGGFHAQGIREFAAENQYNYISILPRISKVTSEDFARYRRALLGEVSARNGASKASETSPALVTSPGIFSKAPAAAGQRLNQLRLQVSGDVNFRSERRIDQATTSEMKPEDELELLLDVKERLVREREELGSGELPEVVQISDIHGAIDKFDALIVDAIRRVLPFSKMPSTFEFTIDHNKPLFEQLEAFGITANGLKGKVYFENLGDDMDRGPDGLAVWARSRELIGAGLAKEITGNHNGMVFINLAGLHLPFYEGYNFYGYSDSYDQEKGSIQELVRQFHIAEPRKAKNKVWWASRLAQFMAHQKKRQQEVWSRFDDEVNGPKDLDGKRDARRALYVPVLAELPEGSNAKKIWDKLRGWYLVDVYTGVRDAGGMSLVWWKNLLNEFEKEYASIQKSDGWFNGSPADKAWARAIQMMRDEIIPEYQRDLEEQLSQGNWWWRAFEALNAQNYTSVEWYAKDWIFHKGWGTSILDELNRNRDDLPEITAANYLENPILKKIAESEKANFTLFLRNIYQHTSLHAFLPVNSQGQFYFTYKGVEYKGKGKAGDDGYPSIWEGLKLITEDVRNPEHGFLDMYEALTLFMSWYADNTTKTKPGEILRVLNHFGPEKLAEENGFNALTTAHIPFQQFAKITPDKRGVVTSYNVGGRFFFSDHDMSPAYRYRGLGIWKGPMSGVLPRGFEHDGNRLIDIKNEPRMIDRREGGAETVHFHHRAIPREFFINSAIEDVDRRIEELKKQLNRSEHRTTNQQILEIGQELAPKINRLVSLFPEIRAKSGYQEELSKLLEPAVNSVQGIVSVAGIFRDKESLSRALNRKKPSRLMSSGKKAVTARPGTKGYIEKLAGTLDSSNKETLKWFEKISAWLRVYQAEIAFSDWEKEVSQEEVAEYRSAQSALVHLKGENFELARQLVIEINPLADHLVELLETVAASRSEFRGSFAERFVALLIRIRRSIRDALNRIIFLGKINAYRELMKALDQWPDAAKSAWLGNDDSAWGDDFEKPRDPEKVIDLYARAAFYFGQAGTLFRRGISQRLSSREIAELIQPRMERAHYYFSKRDYDPDAGKLLKVLDLLELDQPGTSQRLVDFVGYFRDQRVSLSRSEQRNTDELDGFLENIREIKWPGQKSKQEVKDEPEDKLKKKSKEELEQEPFKAAYKIFDGLRRYLNKLKLAGGDDSIQFNFPTMPREMDAFGYWQARIRAIQEDKNLVEAEDFWLEALSFEYELMLRVQIVAWRADRNLNKWIEYLAGWSSALDQLTAELIRQKRFSKFKELERARYVPLEGLYEAKPEKLDSGLLDLIFEDALTEIPGLDETSLAYLFQKAMRDRMAADRAAMTDIEKIRWLEHFKNLTAYEMLYKPEMIHVLAQSVSNFLTNWHGEHSEQWNPFWEISFGGLQKGISRNQGEMERRLGKAAIHSGRRSEMRMPEKPEWLKTKEAASHTAIYGENGFLASIDSKIQTSRKLRTLLKQAELLVVIPVASEQSSARTANLIDDIRRYARENTSRKIKIVAVAEEGSSTASRLSSRQDEDFQILYKKAEHRGKGASELAGVYLASKANQGDGDEFPSGAETVFIDADIKLRNGQKSAERLLNSLMGEFEKHPHTGMVMLHALKRRFSDDDGIAHFWTLAFTQGLYGLQFNQSHGGEFALSRDAAKQLIQSGREGKLSALSIDGVYDLEHSLMLQLAKLISSGELGDYHLIQHTMIYKDHTEVEPEKIFSRMGEELIPRLFEMALSDSDFIRAAPDLSKNLFYDDEGIEQRGQDSEVRNTQFIELVGSFLENHFHDLEPLTRLDPADPLLQGLEADIDQIQSAARARDITNFEFNRAFFAKITQNALFLFAQETEEEKRLEITRHYMLFVKASFFDYAAKTLKADPDALLIDVIKRQRQHNSAALAIQQTMRSESRLKPIAEDQAIVAFGSSTVSGVVHPAMSFPALLGRMVSQNVINSGVGGEGIEGAPRDQLETNGVSRLGEVIEKEHPALLVLFHGRNDLADGKNPDLVEAALLQMIRDANKKGAQVLLLGASAPGATNDSLIYKRAADQALSEGLTVYYFPQMVTHLLENEILRADGIHANEEGNFLIAESIAELLWEQGVVDRAPDTAVVKKGVYLNMIIQILNRNLFLLQGSYSQNGWPEDIYNDKDFFQFKDGHPDPSAVFTLSEAQLDEKIRGLEAVVDDRIRMGKLNDMRAHHPADEQELLRLMHLLGAYVEGFTPGQNNGKILTRAKVRPALPMAGKNILLVPTALSVAEGSSAAMEELARQYPEIVMPIYETAAQVWEGIFSISQLMLKADAAAVQDRSIEATALKNARHNLAHFLYVLAQYRVLKSKAPEKFLFDFISGDSLGIGIAMVLAEALPMEQFLFYLKGRFEMSPAMLRHVFGRIVIPFSGDPAQIEDILEPGKIEAMSFGGDGKAYLIVNAGQQEMPLIKASLSGALGISSNLVVARHGIRGWVHHSFYPAPFENDLRALVERLSFLDSNVPIMDPSFRSSAQRVWFLESAVQMGEALLHGVLGTVYWHHLLQAIPEGPNHQIWISSAPDSWALLEDKFIRSETRFDDQGLAQEFIDWANSAGITFKLRGSSFVDLERRNGSFENFSLAELVSFPVGGLPLLLNYKIIFWNGGATVIGSELHRALRQRFQQGADGVFLDRPGAISAATRDSYHSARRSLRRGMGAQKGSATHNHRGQNRSEIRSLIAAGQDPGRFSEDAPIQELYRTYRELAILNESIKPFYEYPASTIVEARATGDALTQFLEKLDLLSPEAHELLFNAMAAYYRTDSKQPIKSVRRKLEEAVSNYKKKIKKGGINNLENRKWAKGFAMLVSTGIFQIKLNLTYGDLSAYAESFAGDQINPLFERARAGLRARVFGLGSLTSFRTEIGVLSRHQQPDIYSPSEHFAYRALGFEPVYSGPNDVLSLVVGLGLNSFEVIENEGIPVVRFSFKDEINDLGGDKQDSMTAFVLLGQPRGGIFEVADEDRQTAYEEYLRSFAVDLSFLRKFAFQATDDSRDKAAKTAALIQYLQANPGKLLPNADYMLKDELSRARFLDQLSETPAAKDFLSQKLGASAGFLEKTIADFETSRATEAEELPAKIEAQLEYLARVAAGQVQEVEREEIEPFESMQGTELRLLLDIAETFDLASDFLENLSNHAIAARKATAFIGRLMSAYPMLRDQILARAFNLKWDSRNPKPLSRETLAARMKVFSRYLKTRFHDANPIVKAARAAFFQTRVHILEQLYTSAANTAIFDNPEFESEFRKILRRGWRRYLVALNQTDLVIPSAGFLVGAEGHAFHLYPLYHLLQSGMKPALHGESLALKIQSAVPVSSEVVEQSREYGTPPVTAVNFSGTIKNHLGFESNELHFFILREPLPLGEEITFEIFQSLFENDPAALQPILLSENASADEAYAWQERLVELARAGRLLAIHDWYPDASKIETLLDFIHLDGADSKHARAQIEILLKNLETDPGPASLATPDYRQAYLEHQKNKPKKDLGERLFSFSPDFEILEDRLSRLLEATSVQFAAPALDLFFMTAVAARAEGPLMPEDQFLIFIEEWTALQRNESVRDWAIWLQERFAQQESNPFMEQEIRIQGADYLFGKFSGIIPSQYRSWFAAFFPKAGEKMVGDAVNWSQPERAKKFVQTWALASRNDRPVVIQGMQPDLDWLQSGLYRHGFSTAQAGTQWGLYADLILAPVLSRLRAELNSAREEYEVLGGEMTAEERVSLESKIELIEDAIAELGLSESEIEKIIAKEGRTPSEDDSAETNRTQTANERARTQLENLKIARESQKLIAQIEQTEFDQVDSGKFSSQKKALARGLALLPPAHPETVIAAAALAEKIDTYLSARLSLPYIRDRAYDFLIQELGSDESWAGPERVAAWKKRIQEHRAERDTQRERKIVEPRIAAMQAHLEGIVVASEAPAAIQVWAEELIEMIEKNRAVLNGTADSLISSAKSVWAKKLIEWLRFKTKEMREAPIEAIGLEDWDKDEAQIKAVRTKLLELSVSVIPEELTESGAGLIHKRNALAARIEGFKIKLKDRIKALDEVNFETVTQEAFVEQIQDIKTSIEDHAVWLGADSSQSFQANLRTKQNQVAPFVALAEQIRSTGETKHATTTDIGKAFQPLRQRLDKLQKSNRPLFLKLNDLITAKKQEAERALEERMRLREEQKKAAAAEKEKPPVPEAIAETGIVLPETVSEATPSQEPLQSELETVPETSINATGSLPQQIDLNEDWPEVQVEQNEQTEEPLGYIGLVASASMAIEKQLDVEKPWQLINAVSSWIDAILESTANFDAELRQQYYAHLRHAIFSARARVRDPLVRELSDFLYEKLIYLWHQREKDLSLSRESLESDWRAFYQPALTARVENELINYRPENEKKLRLLVNFFEPLKAGKERQAYMSRIDSRPKELWLEKIGDLTLLLHELKKRLNPKEDLNEVAFPALAAFHALRDQAEIYLETTVEQDNGRLKKISGAEEQAERIRSAAISRHGSLRRVLQAFKGEQVLDSIIKEIQARSEMRENDFDQKNISEIYRFFPVVLKSKMIFAFQQIAVRTIGDLKAKTDEALKGVNEKPYFSPQEIRTIRKTLQWIEEQYALAGMKQAVEKGVAAMENGIYTADRNRHRTEAGKGHLQSYLSYLTLKPSSVSWSNYIEGLPAFEGDLGVTNQAGVFDFLPLVQRRFSWSLAGAAEQQGVWKVRVANPEIVGQFIFQFQIILEREGVEPIVKTFQIKDDVYHLLINEQGRKGQTRRVVLEISERIGSESFYYGTPDFRSLPDILSDPKMMGEDAVQYAEANLDKMNRLSGARLGVTDEKGGVSFAVYPFYGLYHFSIVGKHAPGYEVFVDRFLVKQGRLYLRLNLKKGKTSSKREFQIGPARRRLKKRVDSKAAPRSVLRVFPASALGVSVEADQTDAREITTLAELVTHSAFLSDPSKVDWRKEAERIADFKGLRLSNKDGHSFRFTPYKNYALYKIGIGTQAKILSTRVISSGVSAYGKYEIKIAFTVREGEKKSVIEKTYQIAPFTHRLKKTASNSDAAAPEFLEVLALRERPALELSGASTARTLVDLLTNSKWVENPSAVKWEDEIENLQVLVGQRLGAVSENGAFGLSPYGKQVSLRLLGFKPSNDEKWQALISKVEVNAWGVLELTIRFESGQGKVIERVFQVGRKAVSTIPSDPESEKWLALENKAGLEVLGQITSAGVSAQRIDWNQHRELVGSLAGLRFGESTNLGRHAFTPVDYFPYDWSSVGFTGDAGSDWNGLVVRAEVNQWGVPEFEVLFAKAGEEPFKRIFQIAPYKRVLRGQLARRGETQEVWEISDKPGVVALRNGSDQRALVTLGDFLKMGPDTNWTRHIDELKRLKGLRLGMTAAGGSINFAAYSEYANYTWYPLGEKKTAIDNPAAGWLAQITDVKVNQNTPVITVRFEKQEVSGTEAGKPKKRPIVRHYQIGPGRKNLSGAGKNKGAPVLSVFSLSPVVRSELRADEGGASVLSRGELLAAKIFAAGFISLGAVKRVLGLAPEARRGLWSSLTPPEKQAKEILFAQSILFGKQIIQPDDAFVIGTDLALKHGFLAAVKAVFPGTAFAVVAKENEARDIQDWIDKQGIDNVAVAETAALAQDILREKNPRAMIRGLALTASDEAEKLTRSLPDLEVIVFTSGQLDRMLGFTGVVEEAAHLAQMAQAFAIAA